ncbi:MAG: diguanylate cyclase (GGDEF)-like protein [Gammaproteobacteria bacterium]|jgi:diguanylate cyclase (GGDEF)-like protein
MKDILVQSLMTKNVSCLSPNAPLRDAVALMVENCFSCVVVKQQQSPIGIVTERDLVKILFRDNPEYNLSQPISNFMSSPVLSLNQDESLFDALVVNRAEKVRHLAVVNDNNKLVGLITTTDLVNAHFKVTEMQSQLIERAISSKTRTLQRLNEELKTLSMIDHLMQVGNRRAMEVDLSHTHSGAVRYNKIYALLLLDIDYFKFYNDYYGHQLGDDALRQVADIIKQNIRFSDRLYRYGGEELLIILPHTNIEQSGIVASKIIAAIRDLSIPHQESPLEYLTISIGCTAINLEQQAIPKQWQQLVNVADQALYQAKTEGRDRSVSILPQDQ